MKHIRYGQISLAVMALIMATGFIDPLWAATVSEKESLRGLGGIVLKPMTFVSSPSQVAQELPITDLTREVEQTLRQSGMLLEEGLLDPSSDRPGLEIQGAITQIAANYYAYTIMVELRQQATLIHNASRPTVVTWSEGTLSTGDIEKFQERVRLLVSMFVKDFQQMNSAPSPHVPATGTLSDL